MTPQDKVMWEYFASLYKNSNKGIKGRGKDRRISTVPSSASSSSSFAGKAIGESTHVARSSRSSSYSTDDVMPDAQPVRAAHPHAPAESYQGFEDQPGWGNSVFPERKMF